MDIFAHFLWTFVVFFRYRFLSWCLAFGVLPDFLSWGVYTVYRFFMGIPLGRPVLSLIPDWVFILYGLTHSLIVFAVVLCIVWFLTEKLPVFLLAWGLHILIDIPSHTREFLGTPFLWPVSEWLFPGVSWGSPTFMLVNYSLLSVFVLATLYFRKNVFVYAVARFSRLFK